MGPMAITLCQSLGQNLGMLRSKERSAAGKKQHTAQEVAVVQNPQILVSILILLLSTCSIDLSNVKVYLKLI